ncbi:MAG: GntR family transcriptional regulator [Rhizobacter sp.]
MSLEPLAAPQTLAAHTRRAVLAAIADGRLEAGGRYSVAQLAGELGVSRTPVREALLVLAAQGLVHIAPRSGIYVRQASIDELVASLEALTEVESVLAGMAARRASAAHCAELRTAMAACTERAAVADVHGYESANRDLHQVIYRASGNPVLVETVRSLRRTLAAYRQCSIRHPGRLGASAEEHGGIVAAICAGDPVAAATAMRKHINLGGEALVELVVAAQTLGAKHDTVAPRDPARATRRAPSRR